MKSRVSGQCVYTIRLINELFRLVNKPDTNLQITGVNPASELLCGVPKTTVVSKITG